MLTSRAKIGYPDCFLVLLIIFSGRSRNVLSKFMYRGADKSLTLPGKEQANVSVRMVLISFGALSCRKKNFDHSSLLDIIEIAQVPSMLPSLCPSWSG